MLQATLIRDRFLADARRHLLANAPSSETSLRADEQEFPVGCTIEAAMGPGTKSE